MGRADTSIGTVDAPLHILSGDVAEHCNRQVLMASSHGSHSGAWNIADVMTALLKHWSPQGFNLLAPLHYLGGADWVGPSGWYRLG